MGKAFVFSLDAFVALMLVLLAVNSAVALSSAPKGYYSSLEQAHDLAKDTLRSMHAAQYGEGLTYVDAVLAGGGDRLLAIRGSAEKAIPMQFGYRFDRFDALANTWETLYDSAADSSLDSPRHGRLQRKLSASYRLFFSSYEVAPNRGESPFCYKSCSGVSEMPPVAEKEMTDAQSANVRIGGQQYSKPLGMGLEGELESQQIALPGEGGVVVEEGEAGGIQSEQVSLPNDGWEVVRAGGQTPGPFESVQVNLGNNGAVVSEGGQQEKFCMSPCDLPHSFYGEGTPFVGQLRLTVYS